MRILGAMVLMLCMMMSVATAAVRIDKVTAQQRYPWNGLVDIVVTIQGETNEITQTECVFVATNCETGAAVTIDTINQVGADSFTTDSCTRRYRWNASNDVGSVKIDDLALTVNVRKDLGGVQLWENGPIWAECNVGATKPEEYGYYFWWGDTVGYKRNANNDGWVSVKDGTSFSFSSANCSTYWKDNSALLSAGYIDSTGNLVAAHDAATAHLSAPWRMPTYAEIGELISNCDTTWATSNGVTGRLITGRGAYASKSIFLPAAGYGSDSYLSRASSEGFYWSSEWDVGYSYRACLIKISSDSFHRTSAARSYGSSIRPLRGFVTDNAVGFTTHLKLDCRAGVRMATVEGANILFDVDWYVCAETIRITDNDVVLTNGTAGSFIWCPAPCGATRHLLKLEVLSNDEVTDTETAEFDPSTPTAEHTVVVTKPEIAPTSGMAGRTAEICCSRCGEIVQTAEAIPALGYIRNVTARQLWPHNKIEVCYDLAEDIGEVADKNATLQLEEICGQTTNSVSTILGISKCVPGRHCVVWDCDADNFCRKAAFSMIVKCGDAVCESEKVEIEFHNADDRMLHRWSFNGNLLDTAGDQTATAVGNVSTDGKVYRTLGGSSGSAYIDLGDWILPTTGEPFTIEMWVTEDASVSFGRIYCFGSMLKGGTFSKRDTSNYSTDCLQMCWNGECTACQNIVSLGSFDVGREYHLASVFEPNADGTWKGTYYKQDATTGETLSTCTGMMKEGWTIGSVKQTEMVLGQALTTWDSCAKNSYNELRIWSGALTQYELSQRALNGPDEDYPSSMIITNDVLSIGYSPIDAGNATLEINGRTVLTATESGTYEWTPDRPGTYVLAHRAGTNVWTRNVVCTNAADMAQLEIGWLDGPVSNYFPNIYASVTNVVIAASVTSLPKDAFAGCAGLDADDSGLLVYGGWALGYIGEAPAEIEIPEGVVGIAASAFEGQWNLENVSLPSTLKYISERVFAECTAIEELTLPNGVEVIGDEAFRDCTWMQDVVFPATVKDIGSLAFANCSMLDGVEIPSGVKTIGEGAFSNCWRMISVSLPASVDAIGDNAFHNCKSLTGVTIPTHVKTIAELFPSVYATITSVTVAEGETALVDGIFAGCAGVEEIALNDLIAEISDNAFSGCASLRTIAFPANLKRIGANAFANCPKILALPFNEGLETIGAGSFSGLSMVVELNLPSSLKDIGESSFKDLAALTEIAVPVSVTNIGANAFAGCGNIRRVALPATPTSVPAAFPDAYAQMTELIILGSPKELCDNFCRGCASVGAVSIPSSVERIGSYAFYQVNLTTIKLPTALRNIGECAFGSCAESELEIPFGTESIAASAFANNGNLATVSIPNSVTNMAMTVFSGCAKVRAVKAPGNLLTMSAMFPAAYGALTKVEINADSEELMAGLFENCSSLSSIILPQSVTKIGSRCFKNCTALTESCIPNRVTELASEAFSGCSRMLTVALPSGLTAIGDSAFAGCSAFSSVVMPETLATLGANVFSGCTALKSISYLGSCPSFDASCYAGTANDLQSYVVMGSRGWDGVTSSKALPENWPASNARAISYWTPNTFTVTFDGNGGTPAATSVVQTTGMTYQLPVADPTRLGARFNGWWTERINGGEVKSVMKAEVVRDQTLYAHWKWNEYAIRFDANGGEGAMSGLALAVNTEIGLTRNAFYRMNHQFAGWSLTQDGDVAFADGASVMNLSYEQDAVVTLYAVWTEKAWGAAEYLNESGRAFAMEGDADWEVDDEVSHDGVGSMRSGAIAAAKEGLRTYSVLSTAVVGEGSGSFWWKVDCEPSVDGEYYDFCSFSIDDVVVTNIAGTVDWERISYVVSGVGEHTLTWTFTRDDWDEDETLYENAAWIDEFGWTPTPVTLFFAAGGAEGDVPGAITRYAGYEVMLPAASRLSKSGMVFVGWSDGESTFLPGAKYVIGSSDTVLTAVWEAKVWTLAEAVNATNLLWATGGNAEWSVDLETSHDGEAALRSGSIGASQTTWLETQINGAGTISFWWKSEGYTYRGSAANYVQCLVDGVTVEKVVACDWTNVCVAVAGAGPHTIRWSYTHSRTQSSGADAAWLDGVAWAGDPVADPIPELENPTTAEIREVLQQADDPKLAENVTNGTGYAAFREWSGKVQPKGGGDPIGAAGVMSAPNAWLSFAVASDTLIDKAPTNGQMRVEKFEPTSTAGSFDFTVSIDDIVVGSEATKENLKKVFGLEGGATLDALSSTNVDISFGTPENGKVKFTAGPNAKNADAKAFFMKVKMTP